MSKIYKVYKFIFVLLQLFMGKLVKNEKKIFARFPDRNRERECVKEMERDES